MSLTDLLLGRPLATEEEKAERIAPGKGIPIFGLDALSSAAYGPEAALTLLIPLGMAIAVKLIPKDVLADSRVIAQAKIDSKKPVNWVAGGIVIGIWVAVIAYVCYRLIQGTGK